MKDSKTSLTDPDESFTIKAGTYIKVNGVYFDVPQTRPLYALIFQLAASPSLCTCAIQTQSIPYNLAGLHLLPPVKPTAICTLTDMLTLHLNCL